MTPERTSFAWTATEGYEHFPPFVNLTGNRLAVRGPEIFNGRHYEHGHYAFIELPPEALDKIMRGLAEALAYATCQHKWSVGCIGKPSKCTRCGAIKRVMRACP